MSGWISLDRKIKNHWIWKNSDNLKMWIDFIMRANHTEGKLFWNSSLIIVNRGSFITSLKGLAIEYHCSIAKIRTFLNLLKKDSMINTETTPKYTRITICNYDTYQDTRHAENTQNENKTKSKNTQKDTNNKNNKDNKDNNSIYMSIFDEVRKIYGGEKRGLETEFNNFIKHLDWKAAINLLKPAIEKERNHKRELTNQKEFCPPWKNFRTWINQRCWEQEFPNYIKTTHPQNTLIIKQVLA
jgi:hypothetical protein